MQLPRWQSAGTSSQSAGSSVRLVALLGLRTDEGFHFCFVWKAAKLFLREQELAIDRYFKHATAGTDQLDLDFALTF